MSAGATSREADPAQPVLLWRASSTAIAAGLILLIALVLRILGARGELWLDELWSLKLIDEVRRRHDFFWGLAVDNNHYLNTLYLWLVGADAPAMLQRGLSILLGTATVALAPLAVRTPAMAGPLSAMLLFATSYPMVNYGSEARGYAGLILMILLAILLTESAAAGSKTNRRWLGLVNLLGIMFQPIMLGAVAALIGWTAWLTRPERPFDRRAVLAAVTATSRTFSWTVRLLIPFAALIAFSVLHADGYRIAGTIPFSVEGFAAGYGGLIRWLLGLPDAGTAAPARDWIALAVAAAATAGACAIALDNRRRAFYLIFMLGLPLAMLAARLPNVVFPRYYLASGIVFLLILAELFAWSWNRGGAPRIVALVLLAAIVAGNSHGTLRLLRDGRDQTSEMMRMIASNGPVLVTTDQDIRNRPVIEFFADRFNLPVTYVPTDEICARNPEWLLSSSVVSEMPEALDTSIVGCRKIFTRQASFPQWGLSGLPWTVYRAAQ